MVQELNEIVRIGNVDIDGRKRLVYGLSKIKGVKYSFAHMICHLLGLEKNKRIGELTEEEVSKIEDFLKNPIKYNAPAWMLNHRKDRITGEDLHKISNDLDFTIQQNINIMKKIKSYRGVRHSRNLTVRGQRTKSNFRRSKIVRNRKIKKR